MPVSLRGTPHVQLLVSVRSPADASAALAGGADVIDAKEPAAGALGPVTEDVFQNIAAVVARARPLTAALGDAADPVAVEHAACVYAAAGALLVKIGFAGIASAGRIAALIAAAARGARAGSDGQSGVVAVAYADADTAVGVAPTDLLEVAARAGASGVLLDTADKDGPGLTGLFSASALTAWVARAHEAGLLAALAGRLAAPDFALVRRAGADIVGVRGAVCDGGRNGLVRADRVRALRELCAPDSMALGGPGTRPSDILDKSRKPR